MTDHVDDILRETYRKNARSLEFVPVVDVQLDDSAWQKQNAPIAITGHEALFAELFGELTDPRYPLTTKRYRKKMGAYARQGLPFLSKAQLLHVYREECEAGRMVHDEAAVTRIQLKPTRSQAGVTVVTVLTKPFPCPGKCIFCPTDVRMPKSYLHDEPGAQRAERHQFDPFAQVQSRITALTKMGHPTDKIELIILGGTWSSYPREYQEWFVKRCFDGMNGVDAADLPTAHAINTTTHHRNVGLVVETRQDNITPDELRWFRYLGVTKVQVGIQSMDERVLALNKRGHDAQATRDAFRLLRLAGFKIHGHWMANLLGGSPESDIADYHSLWDDVTIRPDELKIYPCMLVKNAELFEYYQRGEYRPYTEAEVQEILISAMVATPRYCRLTRVIRDIPTTNVVEGNKKANLRQLAQNEMDRRGLVCNDIRSREIRRDKVTFDDLSLVTTTYETDATIEHFLSFETADGRLAGFLRISFPHQNQELPLPELENHAMIREVHVYGPALTIGTAADGDAQHIGLGSQLVMRAKEMAAAAGYTNLAVISAVGTQNYYKKHGFVVDGLYMTVSLSNTKSDIN